MTTRRALASLTVLAGFLAASAANAAENVAFSAALSSIVAADAKTTVDALADDIFEGREAGSRGGHAAGGYLVEKLRALNVQPGGDTDDFYQVFGNQYRNILVIHEGSDPQMKDQYIVVSAHYDHVGYGNSSNSYGPTGFIHNGADDNASGTATLLEVIEAFTTSGITTKRSVLFVFFDAEEKGLLGSRHWIRNPTVPLENVPIMLNVDMVGRLRDNTLGLYGTRSAPGLRQLVSRQNRNADLQLDFTWKNKANSDHYPFYERDIPFLMLHTGLHDDYHRPSDDAEKVNSDGIQHASRLLFSLAHKLATRDELPAFRSASRSESNWQRRQQAKQIAPAPPRIGVRWAAEDEQGNQGEGLRITEAIAGRPAQRGGLQAGDRITLFAGEEVASGLDFRGQVLRAQNPVTVVVSREGEEESQTLTLQLDGSPVRLGISFRTDEASPGEAIVNRVTLGSPADRAGLELRDRIYEVGGESFTNRNEFLALVNSKPAPLELLTERKGHLRKVTLDGPPLRSGADTAAAE